MLVTHIEASFFKKASETLLFTCTDGDALTATIEAALATGEAQSFIATSSGRLPDGALAAEVKVTWSFKAKRGKASA